ncbi:hypothetical protein TCAL_15022 [Tigriopus californicus]|uniref:DUF7041 domain-containing protein n=1 Tax=Tigriopus californicus TaxID=6832 RepID=A0A553NXB3_TIGCA|nr:hypothetical protein TCAL_15022 [Tigriopus californicus]
MATQNPDSAFETTEPVMAVSVKIPRYNPRLPESWFRSAESQFRLAKITTESTKYHHVVRCLEVEELDRFSSIIEACDDEVDSSSGQPYTNFKNHVLKASKKSYIELFEDCIAYRMGDTQPTETLNFLKKLWPDGAASAESSLAFRALFIRKLPESIGPNIAISL